MVTRGSGEARVIHHEGLKSLTLKRSPNPRKIKVFRDLSYQPPSFGFGMTSLLSSSSSTQASCLVSWLRFKIKVLLRKNEGSSLAYFLSPSSNHLSPPKLTITLFNYITTTNSKSNLVKGKDFDRGLNVLKIFEIRGIILFFFSCVKKMSGWVYLMSSTPITYFSTN